MMYNHMLKYPEFSIKHKLYAACQCTTLALYGGNLSYVFKSNKPVYSFITLPIGILLYFRRKKQFGGR